jgi:hypothetical protein
VIAPALPFLLRIALATCGHLCFHMNFRIDFSISEKNDIVTLMWVVLNL